MMKLLIEEPHSHMYYNDDENQEHYIIMLSYIIDYIWVVGMET